MCRRLPRGQNDLVALGHGRRNEQVHELRVGVVLAEAVAFLWGQQPLEHAAEDVEADAGEVHALDASHQPVPRPCCCVPGVGDFGDESDLEDGLVVCGDLHRLLEARFQALA